MMLVPAESLVQAAPSRTPAFFNPKAKLSRDFSIIAYSAFLDEFGGPRIFLDGMAGVGARSLRVASEMQDVTIVANDANPNAVALMSESARINGAKRFKVSENETCRFLSSRAKEGCRGAIVDIDPFGSPAKFIDCGIRAVMHGGLLSVTATDLRVLSGVHAESCVQKYGGRPLRISCLNEIGIRLVIGCMRSVAARLDTSIQPLFAESDHHYYRIYAKVKVGKGNENLGYIFDCSCGSRGACESMKKCPYCGSVPEFAGPLWTGRLFDDKFVDKMITASDACNVDRQCRKTLEKCAQEAEMEPAYYTIDEVASRAGRSPQKLQDTVRRLRECGFASSVTSFDPTGFRTNAGMREITASLYRADP